jgi:hypothetical protein
MGGLVLLAHDSLPPTQATNEQATTRMHLVISQGGMPLCDSSTEVTCALTTSSNFTVQIVPASIPIGGYGAYQTLLNYGALQYNSMVNEDKMAGGILPMKADTPPIVGHGNTTGFTPPLPATMQKAPLVTLSFTCSTPSATLDLISYSEDPAGSVFVKPDGQTTATPETGAIEVQCVGPSPTSTPTTTPTPTHTPTPTNTPPDPSFIKGPALKNMFLTRQGTKIPPASCLGSDDAAVFAQGIDAKASGLDKHGEPRELGAFQFQLQYDETKVCVELGPGLLTQAWLRAGGTCIVQDSVTQPTQQGVAVMACTKLGKDDLSPAVPDPGNRDLAFVIVRPMPDVYSQMKANNGNGITTPLLNIACKLGDEQGDPIAPPPGTSSCTDSHLTIRFLEGDVEPSCEVDTADLQAIAFRWNSAKGNLLYNWRFNLEPYPPNEDNDIDVMDMQQVYGRFGSTCVEPHPEQPPVNPKT